MTEEKTRGVVWLAFGEPFFMMACHSARTLAEHTPDIGRYLLTNLPIDSASWRDRSLFTGIRHVEAPDSENRIWKTSAHTWTPFDQTIYLDCDTEIRGDISPLYEKFWNVLAAVCTA